MTNPAWDTITNLSIQTYVYDKNGFKLSDSATIYANDHHQAIVVVSFQALDKNGNVISGSELGSIGVISQSTQLTDFETGTTLGELKVWTTDTGKSVFACPLGSSEYDDSICTGNSIENNDTVVLTFYVSTNNKAGKAESITLGMQVNLKALNKNANSNIIESRKGGDLQVYCDLIIIDRSKIPEDIMVGHVSYETTSKDTIPTEVNISPVLEDYYRIVHYAYNFKFDGDSQTDDDFDYNNRIFRIGVFSDPPYNGNQDPNKDETDSEQSEEPHALTEPCCFIDQSDGFYNYKGYLWPIGFYEQSSIYDDTPKEIDTNGADVGNFILDQPRFTRKTVNPIEVFKKSPYELDKSQTLYLTMYLTFGDMVQYYRRQIFYKLDIIDQYGNNLEIQVNPQNTPSIFNKDSIEKCGISSFTATGNDAVKWLTNTKIPDQYNTIGDSTDVGFWLIAANNRYWTSQHTLMYESDALNNMMMIPRISIAGLVSGYGYDLPFRTYRTEGMNNTPMNNLSYKMTMVHQKGNGEALTTGILDTAGNYHLDAVSILPIDDKIPTYTWKFFPVWDRGCFITWVESGNLGYLNATLIDNPDIQGYHYEIGNPEGRNEMSLFSTVQALELTKSGMPRSNVPVKDVLDAGTGGNGNPYAYDPSPDGKSRGDWAAVDAPLLTWGEHAEPVGNSVYSNGLNQVCLILNFNAYTWDMDQNKTNPSKNLPSQDFVENSVALIDYDTGNEINLMNSGWKYTIGDNARTDFCKSPENGAFGGPGTTLPPKIIGDGNFTVKFYISNDLFPTDSIPLNLGVKFTIRNKNWATPPVFTINKNNNPYRFTPVMLKRIAPPAFSINDVDLNLEYNGYLDGDKNVKDDGPENKEGTVPTNAKNYNRLWTLSIDFKSTTSPNLIARGWRTLKGEAETGKFLPSEGVTVVGKRSEGIYHNEFLLSPIGAFVDSTMKKATRIENFIGKQTLINYQSLSINDSITETSSSLIKIYIAASFLGKSQKLEYFPPLNLAFYDQYGNSYSFSLGLKGLEMRLGKLSSDPDINPNSLFNLDLDPSEPQKENPKPEPYYYFSTTDSDHTILTDFSSSNNNGNSWKANYGVPNTVSRTKIIGINQEVFAQKSIDIQTSQFYIWYYDKPKSDDTHKNLCLGKNYTSSNTIAPYKPNWLDSCAAGYLGVGSHFAFYLLPVWGGGKLCFILIPDSVTGNGKGEKKYLSIIDNATSSKECGVYFSDYYDDLSIFSMNVYDSDSKDNKSNQSEL